MQRVATLAEGGEQFLPIIQFLPLTKARVNQTRNFFWCSRLLLAPQICWVAKRLLFCSWQESPERPGSFWSLLMIATENIANFYENFCQADTLHLNKPHLTLTHPSLPVGIHSAAQENKNGLIIPLVKMRKLMSMLLIFPSFFLAEIIHGTLKFILLLLQWHNCIIKINSSWLYSKNESKPHKKDHLMVVKIHLEGLKLQIHHLGELR